MSNMQLTAQEMYDIVCYGCDGLSEREDFIVTSMVAEGWTVNQIMSEVFEDRDDQFHKMCEWYSLQGIAA